MPMTRSGDVQPSSPSSALSPLHLAAAREQAATAWLSSSGSIDRNSSGPQVPNPRHRFAAPAQIADPPAPPQPAADAELDQIRRSLQTQELGWWSPPLQPEKQSRVHAVSAPSLQAHAGGVDKSNCRLAAATATVQAARWDLATVRAPPQHGLSTNKDGPNHLGLRHNALLPDHQMALITSGCVPGGGAGRDDHGHRRREGGAGAHRARRARGPGRRGHGPESGCSQRETGEGARRAGQ